MCLYYIFPYDRELLVLIIKLMTTADNDDYNDDYHEIIICQMKARIQKLKNLGR
jgi:hypothetical protein